MGKLNNSTKVSIMCITYNHARYLRECLDSLLKQKTNFKYEIVIHDDASNDGTTDIVKEYAKKYPNKILPLYEKENQYSKNPHFFIKKMLPYLNGKYTAFCEGDDYWIDPDKLQKQYDYMEKHSNCSLCFHNANTISMRDHKIKNLGTHNIYGKHKTSDNNYNSGNLHLCRIGPYKSDVPSASDFFRTKDLKNLPPCFYTPPCADLPLELLLTHQGYAHYIPEAMCMYRRGTGTSVTDHWSQTPQREKERAIKFLHFLNEFDQYTNHQYYDNLRWLFIKYQNDIDIVDRKPLPILANRFRRYIYRKQNPDPLYIKLLAKSYLHKPYYNIKRILKRESK